MIKRDPDLAIRQIYATIRRQLEDCPPGNLRPIMGLTDGHKLNLAKTIAGCLDEYGRIEEGEDE